MRAQTFPNDVNRRIAHENRLKRIFLPSLRININAEKLIGRECVF